LNEPHQNRFRLIVAVVSECNLFGVGPPGDPLQEFVPKFPRPFLRRKTSFEGPLTLFPPSSVKRRPMSLGEGSNEFEILGTSQPQRVVEVNECQANAERQGELS